MITQSPLSSRCRCEWSLGVEAEGMYELPVAASDPVDTEIINVINVSPHLIYVVSPPLLPTDKCLLNSHIPQRGARKMNALARTSQSSHMANSVGRNPRRPKRDPLHAGSSSLSLALFLGCTV